MPLELLDRQREEEVDSPAELDCGLAERPHAVVARAGGLGGVRHPPVREYGVAGEYRARLLRPVADRDHEIPRLIDHIVHALRAMVRPVDSMVAEDFDGERVDL